MKATPADLKVVWSIESSGDHVWISEYFLDRVEDGKVWCKVPCMPAGRMFHLNAIAFDWEDAERMYFERVQRLRDGTEALLKRLDKKLRLRKTPRPVHKARL